MRTSRMVYEFIPCRAASAPRPRFELRYLPPDTHDLAAANKDRPRSKACLTPVISVKLGEKRKPAHFRRCKAHILTEGVDKVGHKIHINKNRPNRPRMKQSAYSSPTFPWSRCCHARERSSSYFCDSLIVLLLGHHGLTLVRGANAAACEIRLM
jgi:hypothetical protein